VRLFLIALASALAGTAAALAVLYASAYGAGPAEQPSAADLQSFAVLTFVPALLLCLLLYAPALLWLSRRRRSCETAVFFTLVPALALNAPVFAVLLFCTLRGGMFFGPGEALLFAAAFAAAGATFGRAFVWWCRRKSLEG
jgi:hypothetical protein